MIVIVGCSRVSSGRYVVRQRQVREPDNSCSPSKEIQEIEEDESRGDSDWRSTERTVEMRKGYVEAVATDVGDRRCVTHVKARRPGGRGCC